MWHAVRRVAQAAEYKQVTVLFADVVRSMDIASAVGAERLREIMTESERAEKRWLLTTRHPSKARPARRSAG